MARAMGSLETDETSTHRPPHTFSSPAESALGRRPSDGFIIPSSVVRAVSGPRPYDPCARQPDRPSPDAPSPSFQPKEEQMEMPRVSNRVAAITILITAVLAGGCGVSKSKYMDVTKARDDLAAQNTKLKSDLDQANKDKTQLESDKAALDGQVKDMQSKITEQEAKQQEFKSTYDQMIGHLQDEVNSGKVEIQEVRDGVKVNLARSEEHTSELQSLRHL